MGEESTYRKVLNWTSSRKSMPVHEESLRQQETPAGYHHSEHFKPFKMTPEGERVGLVTGTSKPAGPAVQTKLLADELIQLQKDGKILHLRDGNQGRLDVFCSRKSATSLLNLAISIRFGWDEATMHVENCWALEKRVNNWTPADTKVFVDYLQAPVELQVTLNEVGVGKAIAIAEKHSEAEILARLNLKRDQQRKEQAEIVALAAKRDSEWKATQDQEAARLATIATEQAAALELDSAIEDEVRLTHSDKVGGW
jgi:hypothetical protein